MRSFINPFFRIITRGGQLVSSRVRLQLMRMKMKRYLKINAHVKHIQHYVLHCSIGDWFVLYQMSKNLNKRFFAEFITVLALTVNPDPNIEPEEPEIYLTEADLERRRNGTSSRRGSSRYVCLGPVFRSRLFHSLLAKS